MRIVLLSFHWVEYPIELANALVARGHEVTLLMSSKRVATTVGDDLDDLSDPRVRIRLFDNHARGLRDPRQLVTLTKILTTVARARPQILHVQEVTEVSAALCLPFWRKIPMVLTVHDVNPHPGSDSAGPDRRERTKQKFRDRAEAIVVHGEKLRERYIEHTDCAPERVHAVPHGCYHTLLHDARADVEREPGAILFFGRIELYKGLGNLIRVYKRLRENFRGIKLIVAGKGNDLANHEADLVAMPECELHKGYLPNREVARLFQRASLVVLPYIEGSQSGVTRIAYPFGVAVIATNVGSIPESIVDGVTGFVVPPGDDAALHDAIASLLADPARLREMGNSARELSETRMSWARVAEDQERLFKGLLADTMTDSARALGKDWRFMAAGGSQS
jgi:glycosyltransferase involved in cell wall biosynthesis